jgi:hypothetical protein
MKKFASIMLLITSMTVVSCDFNTPQQEVTPTFQLTSTPVTPTATLTFTPSATVTTISIGQIQLESPTATFTAGIPTETPTATATLGPYEYTIQPGDELIPIVRQFGYRTIDILDEVVALNGMVSADLLPPPGTVLLIPRQTATPIPEGVDLTSQARSTIGVNPESGLPNYPLGCHTVQEGERMVGIALDYNMTLEQLSVVNPDISFFGCDFDEPAGGPNCGPVIVVNQCVNVFLPTVTPTLSPTPSGSETATAMPTYIAPIANSPSDGALVPGGLLRLMWVSVGVLRQNEVYFIQVTDTTSGMTSPNQYVTRSTSFLLPAEMIPTDGQTHSIQWSVSVAEQNEQGAYRIVSGTTTRTFQWQSR